MRPSPLNPGMFAGWSIVGASGLGAKGPEAGEGIDNPSSVQANFENNQAQCHEGSCRMEIQPEVIVADRQHQTASNNERKSGCKTCIHQPA